MSEPADGIAMQGLVDTMCRCGLAHNHGDGGQWLVCGTRDQWLDLVKKMTDDAPLTRELEADVRSLRLRAAESDARWAAMLARRAGVEQALFDVARGKRAMPTAQELRELALRLGGTAPEAAPEVAT